MFSSETMLGRFCRIASLMRSLCRFCSAGPLRCSDQSSCEIDICGVGPPCPGSSCAIAFLSRWNIRTLAKSNVLTFQRSNLLTIQQRAHILQQRVRAHRAIAVLGYQAIYHVVDAAELLGVGRLDRCSDFDHVAQVGEELLFDSFLQPLMRCVVKLLPAACQCGDADQNLFAEGLAGRIAYSNLLLDRLHKGLI